MGIALFLLVIFSGGGDEDLDLGDGDADFDFDADTNTDFDFGASFIGWLGIGKAPLLLLLATDFSLWGLSGWILNVLVGEATGRVPYRFWGLGGVILFVSLIMSLFAGSLLSRLTARMFAAFGEDTSGDRLIGCVGTVSSSNIPKDKIGQVDVLDPQGNRVSVSATLPQWATEIPTRGRRIIVIDRRLEAYWVIAKDGDDERRWLADVRPSSR